MLESVKLQSIYTWWKMVLDLIIKDEGGNRLVEAKCGKLFHEPSVEELEDGDAGEDELLTVSQDNKDL